MTATPGKFIVFFGGENVDLHFAAGRYKTSAKTRCLRLPRDAKNKDDPNVLLLQSVVAAPELLEALEKLTKRLFNKINRDTTAEEATELHDAQAAIKSALGQQ